jgi:hypothetical protein
MPRLFLELPRSKSYIYGVAAIMEISGLYSRCFANLKAVNSNQIATEGVRDGAMTRAINASSDLHGRFTIVAGRVSTRDGVNDCVDVPVEAENLHHC